MKPDRCPCGGVILADCETWDVPLCYSCYSQTPECAADEWAEKWSGKTSEQWAFKLAEKAFLAGVAWANQPKDSEEEVCGT